MERQNKPPPLSIPVNPPAYLSMLSYHRTPSTGRDMPAWASTRRRNVRRTWLPFNNPAGVMFIALLIVTGTLTWLLIRGENSTTNTSTSSPLSRLPEPQPQREVKSQEDPTIVPLIQDPNIANSTLNFQQIFAINLPSRLDRKDLLTLMATYSNLSITIVPGVRSLAENALPPPKTPGSLRMEEYAVWRAHANIWRKIIEQDITSALIMEDDNDWDINLKEQIPRIMNALDEIRQAKPRKEDDGVVRGGQDIEPWDILYLGSCWEVATTTDKKGRKTFIPIPSDRENVEPHNYNWVFLSFDCAYLGGSYSERT
jgi:hypothetical protein